jgi:glycosyltransferase involved in cell wall biosynthesis
LHIAVIIPAYNVAPYLRDAMVSVLRQSHPDWSMVVVDDGSSDATLAVAQSIPDPRILLIRQANAGVSDARNRGLAASRSDACLFLDADDWLAADALARLAAALDTSPDAPATSGAYARVDRAGCVRLAPQPPRGDLLERLLVRNLFANGGHLLIRRSAVESAGRFRAELRYGEDWEYWTRLASLGSFVAVTSREPVLFLRERPGSAYCRMATDPASFKPGIDAMYANPAVIGRVAPNRLVALRRWADAEVDWVVGRELIRHGVCRDGRRRLGRSLRRVPTLKRFGLAALSLMRVGPFRPYPAL